MKNHFKDLSDTLEKLLNNMKLMIEFVDDIRNFFEDPHLTFEDGHIKGNIVDGGKLVLPLNGGGFDDFGHDDGILGYKGAWEFDKLDDFMSRCLLAHFNYRFPNLAKYSDWRQITLETFDNEIFYKLEILKRSKNFGLAPLCPVCSDFKG